MIETPRLYLRRPTQNDALLLSDLWRNETVRAYLGGPLSDEMIHQKMLILQSHWDHYQFGLMAVVNKNNEALGLCGPHLEEGVMEISYMFFPNFWGNGFAKESLIAVVSYCFIALKVDTVISITQEANQRSCHLLESIGMKHINNFNRYDAIQRTYSVTEQEWQ